MPIVIAHRGAPALGIENTHQGMQAALAAGADAVETDVRVTLDGVAVCVHDSDLLRIAGVHALVCATTFADLRRMHPPLLTLDEALSATGDAGLLLDIKETSASVANVLEQALAGTSNRGRIMLGARVPELAAEFSGRLPDHPVLAFSASPDDAAEWHDAGARWFRLWEADVTEQRVDAARAAGLCVAIMTGDWRAEHIRLISRNVGDIDAASLSDLLGLGPDGILLDDPRLMVQALSRACSA